MKKIQDTNEIKIMNEVINFSKKRYKTKTNVPAIELKDLRIDFGETLAVEGSSFKIKQGEMVTLLGPSGCGKTTTLNAIAGLLTPTSGRILFYGTDVTKASPQKRKLGLVFQNYALYPHMSVYKNIAFPLLNDENWKNSVLRKNSTFTMEANKIIFKANGAKEKELKELKEALFDFYRISDETSFYHQKLKAELNTKLSDAKAALALVSVKEKSEIAAISKGMLKKMSDLDQKISDVKMKLKAELRRNKESNSIAPLKEQLKELKVKKTETVAKLKIEFKELSTEIKERFLIIKNEAKEKVQHEIQNRKESEINGLLDEAKENKKRLPSFAKARYKEIEKNLIEKYTLEKTDLSPKIAEEVRKKMDKVMSISRLVHQEVMAVAERVDIIQNLQKKPTKLSGGQQQRVAIARAIVKKPKVLLMDEPLSNLDAKLRTATREWIRGVQQELGITTVFVTHDQEEAMSISDTIITMSNGKIQQIGSPIEQYKKPKNLFVAKFLGVPEMKTFIAPVTKGSVKLGTKIIGKIVSKEKEVVVGVRPNQFIENPKGFVKGTIESVEYLGKEILGHIMLENLGKAEIILSKKEIYKKGDKVKFNLAKGIHFFNKETEERI